MDLSSKIKISSAFPSPLPPNGGKKCQPSPALFFFFTSTTSREVPASETVHPEGEFRMYIVKPYGDPCAYRIHVRYHKPTWKVKHDHIQREMQVPIPYILDPMGSAIFWEEYPHMIPFSSCCNWSFWDFGEVCFLNFHGLCWLKMKI